MSVYTIVVSYLPSASGIQLGLLSYDSEFASPITDRIINSVEMEVLLWHDEQGVAYEMPEAELQRMRSQLAQTQERAKKMTDYCDRKD